MLSLTNLFWVVLLLATVLAGLSIIYFTFRCHISPMPSSGPVVRTVLQQIGDLPAGSRIYELGSGWGTLAFALADAYPACRVQGFERSPLPYYYARIVNMLRPRPNLILQQQDFLQADLRQANVLVCYLCPRLMQDLALKLTAASCFEGRVVSSTFTLPGWEPIRVAVAPDWYRSRVYVYPITRRGD